MMIFSQTISAFSTQKILVLHSYHQGFEWTDNVSRGIKSVFKNQKKIEIYFQYLDTKRHSSKLYIQKLRELYKTQSKDLDFNVMIVCDNNALTFALKNRKDFHNVPIVFCGINNFQPKMIEGVKNITGVLEEADYESAIKLIKKLHPSLKNIYVINDNYSNTSQILKKKLLKLIPKIQNLYEFQFSFKFLQELSMTELLDKISAIKKDSALLLLNYYKDSQGNFFSSKETLSLIVSKAKVPIYSVWNFYLGKGILGGVLISGRDQGIQSAKMALKILNGTAAKDIPIIKYSPKRYMFDQKLLDRFQINETLLPVPNIIINRKRSFLNKQKNNLIIFAVLLIFCAVMLLFFYQKKDKAEKAYLDSEQRYKQLSEAAFEGIVIHANEIIIDVNERLSKICGYSISELIGKNIKTIIAPEVLKSTLNKINHAKEDAYETILKKKDGTRLAVDVHARHFYNEGELTRIAAIWDMSDRKEREERMSDVLEELQDLNLRLTRSENRLKELNNTKDKFFSIIAHDLRSPISGLNLTLKLLVERFDKISEDRRKKLLDALKDSANNTYDLLENLLLWAQSQRNEIGFNPEEQDIKKVIDENIELFSHTAKSKSIDLYSKQEQPLKALFDRNMIVTVLRNLISNSLKYTPETGEVSVDIIENTSEKTITVFVNDTGIGMDSEKQKQILNSKKYFSTPGTHQEKGTGLGLMLCKEFIEKHGSSLKIKSQPLKGSSFYFKLPTNH